MRLSLSLVLLGLSIATAGACGGSIQDSTGDGTTGSGGTGATGPTTTSSTGAGASGTTSSSSGTTSSGMSTWTKEAPFPSAPQVQTFGGPVLTSPKIYGIFFSDDDASITGPLADFTMGIGSSSYWTAVTSEYGVGAATAQIITVSDTPPTSTTDDAIQTWLAGKFGTDPSFPAAPTADDVYIVYYPAGVSITLEGLQSCVGGGFGGYHESTQTSAGAQFAYAVVPRCTGMPGTTTLQETTGDASHELVEAATDPFPSSNEPAYVLPDFADIYWAEALGGGEVGDMCAQQPQAFTQFPGFPYVVQRIWSNKAAAAGHDPCQPEPAGEVYYNAAPVFSTMVDYTIQGQTVPVRGVQIAVGKSATIPVDFYSDGPIAAWPVKAFDYNSALMGGTPFLTFVMTPPTGENGTVGSLEITVKEAGPGDQELFFIVSSNDGGQTVNWWFGVVTN